VTEILRGAEAEKARLPYFFQGPVMAKVRPDLKGGFSEYSLKDKFSCSTINKSNL